MRLKEIRKQKGLKQNKVAQDLQINVVTYNGYETGKSEPNIQIILKLADYFNVTTDELLGAQSKLPTLSEKSALLGRVNQLTENECHKLNIYAEALMFARVEHKDKINKIIRDEE